MKITKEQIPEWEELIRILSLYSIYRVSLHKMKGMSKTLSFFKKKNTPYESRFYLLQDDYIRSELVQVLTTLESLIHVQLNFLDLPIPWHTFASHHTELHTYLYIN